MIFRIIPLLLITLVLPTWYVYAKFIKHKTYKRGWRISYWIPTILMLLATLLLGLFETHSATHAMLVNIFMFFYFTLAIPKCLFTIISLIGLGLSKLYKPLWRGFNVAGNIVKWGSFVCILYGFIVGAYRLQVQGVEIKSPDIPEDFNGYRIVQFSDMHVGTFRLNPSAVRNIVEKINSLRPDVIVFTGDIVNYEADELSEFAPELGKLHAPDGIYAVLGNHDYGLYRKWNSDNEWEEDVNDLKEEIRGMGWNLLLNQNNFIKRGNAEIAVVGVENDGKPPFPSRGDLPAAMKGIPCDSAMFKMLLSHDPSHWRRKVLPETDIQLTLSGHTHAMQFSLFGWSPAEMVYPEWQGLYMDNGRMLHVNRGTGNIMFAFRWGAWPEITVLTLQKE